jgi:hypothetical protein
MGKAVLILGIIVLSISLLLLASCANEQVAKPLPNGTDTSAPATQPVPARVAKQDVNATALSPSEINKSVSSKPVSATTGPLAGTQASTATVNSTMVAAVVLMQGCIDTDGGKERMVKGSVQYNAANVSIFRTDECLGTDLREWYCSTSGELEKAILVCSKGCQDGRCLG